MFKRELSASAYLSLPLALLTHNLFHILLSLSAFMIGFFFIEVYYVPCVQSSCCFMVVLSYTSYTARLQPTIYSLIRK